MPYKQLGTSVLTIHFLFLIRLINLNVCILYCASVSNISSHFYLSVCLSTCLPVCLSVYDYTTFVYIVYISFLQQEFNRNFFFSLALQPNSSLGPLHKTFRFTSVTGSRTVVRTSWTGDQLVVRPLPVHKHR
jgi:hypothetical protein